ncbi:MAG: hypothetical protein ABJA34_13420, partial [Pseudonocardiales bacterium]
ALLARAGGGGGYPQRRAAHPDPGGGSLRCRHAAPASGRQPGATDPPADYPMQVTGAADAERQRAVIAAIVEAEVHARIFEGGWQIIPAAARD